MKMKVYERRDVIQFIYSKVKVSLMHTYGVWEFSNVRCCQMIA